jgi:hypothetical protein
MLMPETSAVHTRVVEPVGTMLALAVRPDGSVALKVDWSAIVDPLVTTGTVAAPTRTDATIAGNGYATNVHVTRALV